ncbi:MAG: hypothetical protein LBT65_02625 [Synergistaceae bacterium]|jgi:hypothetical protein|nr:hypothetical protein [Synergistaceae bacterium]
MRDKTRRKTLIKYLAVFAVLAATVGEWTECALAEPLIAAYQQIYNMNFTIWRPEGLPTGWYATFDGYPVAQISKNHWVYGRVEPGGMNFGESIAPTEVAVGSVVPMDVPQLARVVASRWRGGAGDTREFRSIAKSGFDNMGVLGDPLACTPVAWKTGRAELLLWLGNRWYRIVPMGGQTVSEALVARHPFIVRTLAEKHAVWTRSDTEDLAEAARSWGYIWRGTIPFASLSATRPDSGGNGGNDGGSAGSAGGGFSGSDSPSQGGGQWDVGGGDSGSPGGEGGGGWDTGGGSGGASPGGGWDGGESPGGSGGLPDGNDGSDGGWDK